MYYKLNMIDYSCIYLCYLRNPTSTFRKDFTPKFTLSIGDLPKELVCIHWNYFSCLVLNQPKQERGGRRNLLDIFFRRMVHTINVLYENDNFALKFIDLSWPNERLPGKKERFRLGPEFPRSSLSEFRFT